MLHYITSKFICKHPDARQGKVEITNSLCNCASSDHNPQRVKDCCSIDLYAFVFIQNEDQVIINEIQIFCRFQCINANNHH